MIIVYDIAIGRQKKKFTKAQARTNTSTATIRRQQDARGGYYNSCCGINSKKRGMDSDRGQQGNEN